MLDRLRDALAELGAAYHYFAQPNAVPPYIVWAEDGSEDLEGDNAHTEAGYSGTIDLYTKTEDDPLTAPSVEYWTGWSAPGISTPCSMRRKPACCTMSGCGGWCDGTDQVSGAGGV